MTKIADSGALHLRRPLRARLRGLWRGRARNRLKLFMLIHSWPSPPLSGALLRWWAIIRHLGERHDLTLATFFDHEQAAYRDMLLRYCREVHAAPYDGERPPEAAALPPLVALRETTRMREIVRDVGRRRFDASLIETIFMARYAELVRAPPLLGEHNIELNLVRQFAAAGLHRPLPPWLRDPNRDADELAQYEDRMWPQFGVRAAVSDPERREIQVRAGTGRTILVQNGTDPGSWLDDARPDTGNVLFTGLLHYYPNIDAVHFLTREIWPWLRRLDPALRLTVAGRSPRAEIEALKAEHGFALVANPPDMRAVAAGASVSVVPLRLGGGTRLKILDAMKLGVPVVTTTLGCEGLDVVDGEHLLVRDDASAFAAAIYEVLHDSALWRRLRENGRRLVEERYRWDHVLAPLDQALRDIAR